MGFPDNYTLLSKCKDTQRYQAVGNSWAAPVIKWIGKKIDSGFEESEMLKLPQMKIGEISLTLLEEFTPNSKAVISMHLRCHTIIVSQIWWI
jgi:hypothetical protein